MMRLCKKVTHVIILSTAWSFFWANHFSSWSLDLYSGWKLDFSPWNPLVQQLHRHHVCQKNFQIALSSHRTVLSCQVKYSLPSSRHESGRRPQRPGVWTLRTPWDDLRLPSSFFTNFTIWLSSSSSPSMMNQRCDKHRCSCQSRGSCNQSINQSINILAWGRALSRYSRSPWSSQPCRPNVIVHSLLHHSLQCAEFTDNQVNPYKLLDTFFQHLHRRSLENSNADRDVQFLIYLLFSFLFICWLGLLLSQSAWGRTLSRYNRSHTWAQSMIKCKTFSHQSSTSRSPNPTGLHQAGGWRRQDLRWQLKKKYLYFVSRPPIHCTSPGLLQVQQVRPHCSATLFGSQIDENDDWKMKWHTATSGSWKRDMGPENIHL